MKITLSVCITAISLIAFAQKRVINDVLQTAQSVRMQGFIGEKLDAAYQNRILAQDVDHFVEPFKNRNEDRCWQTEFWGKWFTSAVLAYRYKPTAELKKTLDYAVDELIKTQSADGYIGNYSEAKRLEQWDIWGRKYCLLGLIAYYDLEKNAKSVAAAKKLADHLIQELKNTNSQIAFKGNHRGMAASSILEPISLLYARTGDKKYLDFAEEIVREWELPTGVQLISKANKDIDVAKRFPKPKTWWGFEQGQKAYEMMSCYEGLLELYRLTGKTEYRTAVEKVWENIRNTEINVAGSGASVECWYGGKNLQIYPAKHYQETCVTATWIKLSKQLLRLTGEAKYADAIEQTYYNALLGSMKPDGSSWAKYSPIAGVREEGEDQCKMGTNCCIASGPRGLFALPLTCVMQNTEGVSVNFFIDGKYTLKTPTGQTIDILQETDYPISGVVKIKLDISKAEKMTVQLRIPEWSNQNEVSINGQKMIDVKAENGFIKINRLWQPNDEISLVLDMRGRVIKFGEKATHIAISRGPIVLAQDSRLGIVAMDEVLTPIIDKNGYIPLDLLGQNKNGIWLTFKLNTYMDGDKQKPPKSAFCRLNDRSAHAGSARRRFFSRWDKTSITRPPCSPAFP